jgi:hypothetical protein
VVAREKQMHIVGHYIQLDYLSSEFGDFGMADLLDTNINGRSNCFTPIFRPKQHMVSALIHHVDFTLHIAPIAAILYRSKHTKPRLSSPFLKAGLGGVL